MNGHIHVGYAAPTREALRAALAACNRAPYTPVLAHVRASICRQLSLLESTPPLVVRGGRSLVAVACLALVLLLGCSSPTAPEELRDLPHWQPQHLPPGDREAGDLPPWPGPTCSRRSACQSNGR